MNMPQMVVLGTADWMGQYYYDFRAEWADQITDREFADLEDTTLCLRLGARV